MLMSSMERVDRGWAILILHTIWWEWWM